MPIIDISAEIKGEAITAVTGRMIFSASAVLHGVSASGLGKQPGPQEANAPAPPKSDGQTGV